MARQTEPGTGDAFWMEHEHHPRPSGTAAVAPERPRHSSQFRMAAQSTEFIERPKKRLFRPIPRIAPIFARCGLGLLIRRCQQRALVLLGESLPVQVVSGGAVPGSIVSGAPLWKRLRRSRADAPRRPAIQPRSEAPTGYNSPQRQAPRARKKAHTSRGSEEARQD
jgi:hypothetical protein